MSRLRALAVSAGFFWLLAIAGCGINPQPEPPSANETAGAGGSLGGGSGGAGGGGEGGHYAANPDAADGTVPPASGLPDGGNDKRNDDFSNEDPSSNTDYNGAFGNIDGGAPAHDAGDGGNDRDGAVSDEEDDSGREPPPVPDGGLGSVMQ
jgi:hypothetical protein